MGNPASRVNAHWTGVLSRALSFPLRHLMHSLISYKLLQPSSKGERSIALTSILSSRVPEGPLGSFFHIIYRSISARLERPFIALLTCIFFMLGPGARADSFPPFQDQVRLGDMALVLNGTGIRKATILGLRVYQAALYLPKTSHSAEEILSSSTPLQIHLRFLRDVTHSKLTEAFEEGAERNAVLSTEGKKALHTLTRAMHAVHEGDLLVFTFMTESVHCALNGSTLVEVHNSELSRALPRLWLGTFPPNEELKSGLLGLHR